MIYCSDKETFTGRQLINGVGFFVVLCVRTPELAAVAHTAFFHNRTNVTHPDNPQWKKGIWGC